MLNYPRDRIAEHRVSAKDSAGKGAVTVSIISPIADVLGTAEIALFGFISTVSLAAGCRCLYRFRRWRRCCPDNIGIIAMLNHPRDRIAEHRVSAKDSAGKGAVIVNIISPIADLLGTAKIALLHLTST
jgi:hypothetical protein